ncbi:MAG: alpha/beta hydrolase [Oceanicaulis sp.]|nr:alpha/beta hydrolase [Oceanicaulis sp.]
MRKHSASPNSRLGAKAALLLAGLTAALMLPATALASERFSIERAGEPAGQTVVFIPGLGTPGEVWTDTARAIPHAHSRLVTLAGFGGSPATGAPADRLLEAVSADLAAWLEGEGIENAVLVGHSLGAQIALQAAAAAPGRVAGVLVVDSAPFFPGLMNPGADPGQAAAFGPVMRAQMESATDEAFTAMTAQGLPVQAASSEAQARVLAWAEASDRAVFAQAAAEALSGDFRPGLDGVAAPVRVLVAHSAITPVPAEALLTMFEAQYAGLQRVDITLVSDSRHFIMLDQPAAFEAELRAFLEVVQ